MVTEIKMINIINGQSTHFSFENVGLLQLNAVLFVVLAIMLY
jgi:hypothetical protein